MRVGFGFIFSLCLAQIALADAPIVQGHSLDTGDTGPGVTAQPVVAPNYVNPDQGQQALVTADDSATSPTSGAMDMSNQLLQLQQAVEDLRGQVELQQHAITQLQATVATQGKGTTTVVTPVSSSLSSASLVASTPSPSATPTMTSLKSNSSNPSSQSSATPSTAPSTVSATASVSNTSLSELDQYQQAYNLMLAKKYSDATVALQSYLQKYPQGQYGSDAHYWLGEIGLLNGDNKGAEAQFKTVTAQFPQSPKASDALLKLGMIYDEEQKWALAKQTFESVVQTYPQSTAATLAKQQLNQLEQSGNE